MAWSSDPILKPYTLENLVDLLSQGLLGTMSRYSHFQIVEWCSRFTEEYDLKNDDSIPLTPSDALDLSDDVIVQWELFIATQYSLDDLNMFSVSDVVLPKSHFEHWLNKALSAPQTH